MSESGLERRLAPEMPVSSLEWLWDPVATHTAASGVTSALGGRRPFSRECPHCGSTERLRSALFALPNA